MEFRPSSTSPESLAKYAALFRACFPTATHLDETYLAWLYAGNPAGDVVGMDAWSDGLLAAHYVCVPAQACIAGAPARVLLSLNTATHPDFQGKGLFTRLAEQTYAMGAERGFAAVYGVANANSTPGFVRKLGFTLLTPLDARIGLGRIDRMGPGAQLQHSMFHRSWDAAGLRWRCANPARPYRIHGLGADGLAASAATGKPGIRAWAELPPVAGVAGAEPFPLAPRLHLGLRPRAHGRRGLAWADIPARFRSSPLNLIFRRLQDTVIMPDRQSIYFGVLDFDAF